MKHFMPTPEFFHRGMDHATSLINQVGPPKKSKPRPDLTSKYFDKDSRKLKPIEKDEASPSIGHPSCGWLKDGH